MSPEIKTISLTLTSNVGEGDKIEIDTRNLGKIIPKMYHSNSHLLVQSNNTNTRKRFEICSKLIKTERRH